MSRKRPRTNSTPTTAVDGGTTSRSGFSTGEPPAVRRSTRNKAPAVPPVVPIQDVNQDEPQNQTRFTRPNPELLDVVAELAAFDSELLAHTKAQHKYVRESKLQIPPEHDSPLTSLGPDGSLPGKALRVTRGIGLNDDGVLHLMGGMGKCVRVKLPEKLTPWVGRLGYACLNTYLRNCETPVFCSRTCRIATIIQRSHPLQDPDQPFHAKKNPPDLNKPANPTLGLEFVQSLGLANARDIVPMLRWNAHNGIHFMRLSSEMFPFASHPTYGYNLDFAKPVLAEAGRVAGSLNHRVTTHPGQFTQLGSPRAEVARAAKKDLEYHDQMLEYLSLPEQLDRDAIMIIHMGGMFGDKEATLKRFVDVYKTLKPSIKRRLVLENDDAGWSVMDILPTCELLDIPLVLDWHHHTISFSEGQTGSHEELIPLLPRIAKLWQKKRITQKMHYSESAMPYNPDGSLASNRDRRKHSARVYNLPPWRSDIPVDLCIEAKDKEQAVFELMRRFAGNGWTWNGVSEIVPHSRPELPSQANIEETSNSDDKSSESQLDLGGDQKRVYWPEGKEDWLRPKKKVRKVKTEDDKRLPDDAE